MSSSDCPSCRLLTPLSGGLISSAVFLAFISIFSFVLWYYPIYTGWRRLHKRGAALLFCKLDTPIVS